MDRAATDRGRIGSVEGLRAYAVVLVFLVHFIDHYFRRRDGTDFNRLGILDVDGLANALAYWLWASHYGVDLFFLLSGFLIFRLVARGDFHFGRFLGRRFVRLYPAFGVALVLYVAYHAGVWGVTYDWLTLLQNAVFLQGIHELGVRAIIVPSWSLTFEWLFYLGMPPLLLLAARLDGGPRARQVLVIGAAVLLIITPMADHYARFVMFFAGAWLAALPHESARRWIDRVPEPLVLLAYVAVTALFSFTQKYHVFSWPYALVCSLLFAKAVYGSGLLSRIFSVRWLRGLGNMSYSFYLLHALVIIAVIDHAGPLISGLPPALHLLAMLTCSMALSIWMAAWSYRLFERPYFAHRRSAAQPEHSWPAQPAGNVASPVHGAS